jgi:hypothetical protein
MKLSMKRSAHRNIVAEVRSQLGEEGMDKVKLDTTVKTLRNRSVGWIVNAIRDIDNEELIKKVSFPFHWMLSAIY